MVSKLPFGLVWVFAAYLLFIFGARQFSPTHAEAVPGSVVIPPTLQTVLYFGDPYFAANVEAIRVLATGGPVEGIAEDYFDRLQLTVALLNPCHEDNYYVANSIMPWAGSVDAANAILLGATDCRYWDEVPPFFLAYNLNFFKREHLKARDTVFEAARRATDNRAGFQRMGIFYEAETYPDVRQAQTFLIAQRDQARDPKLKQVLDTRIGRLAGLIVLQDAQATYEKRVGHALRAPAELIAAGVLKQYPIDPVRLGYVFEDGHFELKQVKFRGMEGTRK
jgi:hypothetical protein